MISYKQLDIWHRTIDLVNKVYTVTRGFPSYETYGLISQLRRASVSVSANIAEGLGRQTKKDTIQFLYIARGSLYELDTLITISEKQGYTEASMKADIEGLIANCLQMLHGLIRRYRNSKELR